VGGCSSAGCTCLLRCSRVTTYVRTYLHARTHTRTYLSVQGQLGLHVGTSLEVGTPPLSHLAVGHHISKVKVVPNSMRPPPLTPLAMQGPLRGKRGRRREEHTEGPRGGGGRQAAWCDSPRTHRWLKRRGNVRLTLVAPCMRLLFVLRPKAHCGFLCAVVTL
jgi:hypothetical protein